MPKIKDVEIFDQKNKVKIGLDFSKDVVTFEAKILKHKDKVYELLIGDLGFKIEITDAEVDRVDATSVSGVYKFYMLCDSTHLAVEVKEVLCKRVVCPSKDLLFDAALLSIEKLEYDAQYLIDDLYSFIHKGLDTYMNGDKRTVKPYFPLAYANIAYIMGKLCGEIGAAALVNHPACDFLAMVWLNGYAAQSALKKAGVKVASTIIPVSDKDLKELQDQYVEFMKKLSDVFQQTNHKAPPQSEEDDDDRDK
jgi:hypothetical protein